MTAPDPPYFPLPLQISNASWQKLELGERLRQAPDSLHYRLQLVAGRLRATGSPQASGARLQLCGLLNDALRLIASRVLATRPFSRPAPLLETFVDLYPPAAVHSGLPPRRYLPGRDDRSLQTLTELFVLAVQNDNRALGDARRLCDDAELQRRSRYREQLRILDRQLGDGLASALQRPPGSLLELLTEPLRQAPDSLEGQLAYIRGRWHAWLPPAWLEALPTALALAEVEFLRPDGAPGESQSAGIAPAWDAAWPEPEAFSPDEGWMPEVVMIAKSTHVWLHQLATRYGREISRLDQIPDAELDQLAAAGINTLWLIGLWERSSASSRLKQLRGNPEAAASAYALYDYMLAADLGGEEAYIVLRDRCYHRGIRLAGDVVPNHTGLYSRWIKEHPEWYLQLPHPPYPDYHYSGPDLSPDPELCLQIEDGYYSHSNAAVVFRHLDRRSGQERFIYHGNDGTHMPWNDTAQLNYLLPEVREAVINTIVAVARRFPVIRFDAAMTLAKKHFQRLWFPPPGAAGIPSRAEHSLSREEFDARFPVEFWREVVDRVALEAPGTLLIAEAFWLMESYFVRTLGMHRVYNSAFMNMLKREENAKYRGILAETLAFNPEILKRFVNFMNNPDEATAVEQFGKGDKYFGVAVLLATLPGLPMFGHGQLEGLTEKYGMEYRRAYRDEAVDDPFLQHHRAQIFPLLRRRRLFSGAEHFELFEFDTAGGSDENVYAFVNGHGRERALVVFNNRAGDSHGRIQQSLPRCSAGEGSTTRRLNLAEALGAEGDGRLYRFREHRSGLCYLRSGEELAAGLELQLGNYDYRVYLDFAEVADHDGLWRQLWQELQGAGMADPDRAIRQRSAVPLAARFERLLSQLATDPDTGSLTDELDGFYRLLHSLCGLPKQAAIAVERAETARKAGLRLPEPAAESRPLLAAWQLLAAATPPPGDPAVLDQLAWHTGELGLAGALATRSKKPGAADQLLLLLRYAGRLAGGEADAIASLAGDPQRRQLTAAHPEAAAGLPELLVAACARLWCWTGHSTADLNRLRARLATDLVPLASVPDAKPAPQGPR